MLGGMQGGGGLAGGSPGGAPQNPLLQVALQLLQQNGGLQGVLGKFQQAAMVPQPALVGVHLREHADLR